MSGQIGYGADEEAVAMGITIEGVMVPVVMPFNEHE